MLDYLYIILKNQITFFTEPLIIRDLSISGDLKELAEARYSTNQSTQVISNKICHHLVSVFGYQENLINEVLTGVEAAIDKYLQ